MLEQRCSPPPPLSIGLFTGWLGGSPASGGIDRLTGFLAKTVCSPASYIICNIKSIFPNPIKTAGESPTSRGQMFVNWFRCSNAHRIFVWNHLGPVRKKLGFGSWLAMTILHSPYRHNRHWSQCQRIIKSSFLGLVLSTSGANASVIKSTLMGLVFSTCGALKRHEQIDFFILA